VRPLEEKAGEVGPENVIQSFVAFERLSERQGIRKALDHEGIERRKAKMIPSMMDMKMRVDQVKNHGEFRLVVTWSWS
jgi:hypothetical protein